MRSSFKSSQLPRQALPLGLTSFCSFSCSFDAKQDQTASPTRATCLKESCKPEPHVLPAAPPHCATLCKVHLSPQFPAPTWTQGAPLWTCAKEKLDTMTLPGLFQLGIFCDSMLSPDSDTQIGPCANHPCFANSKGSGWSWKGKRCHQADSEAISELQLCFTVLICGCNFG